MAVRLKISDFYKSDFEKRANTIRIRGVAVVRITVGVHTSEVSRTPHTTVFQPVPFKFIIIVSGYKFGITPLYNADGTLQVYEE